MNVFDFFERLGYSISLRYKLSAYFLIISLFPLMLISSWAYYSGKESTENKIMAHLISIADLKKHELENWLIEKLRDLEMESENPLIVFYLSGLKAGKRKVSGQSSLQDTFRTYVFDKIQRMKSKHRYKRVLILDSSGKVVISTEEADIGRIISEDYVTVSLVTREIHIKDIFQSQKGDISMIFSSPLYRIAPVEKNNGPQVIGIMAIEIDMEKTVFPMIGHWPGMGKTGETLLVRREGNEVLFLNELRHKKGSALNMRIPDDSNFATSSIFSSDGDEGFLIARDYRGVEVLSAYRNISMMGWGFVAKIDSEEAFRSVIFLRNRIVLFSSLLVSAAIGLAFWFSRDITEPILYLEKMTRRIAGGDFSVNFKIRTRDEIGKLATSFIRMKEDLQEAQEKLIRSEKLAIVGQLASSVGHDLRNPLGVIKNSIYYLNMKLKGGDEKIKKHLNILESEINRSSQIINDLLDFSRKGLLSLEKADINSTIHEELDRMNLPENITVEIRMDENLPEIFIDPIQIKRIFSNIFINAVQAMPEGGRLTINTRVQDEFAEISFTDTGEGIVKENIKKIFDPLFTTKAKGIGLGLAIANSIVERHNGKVEVVSRVGEGTTFTVKLPVGPVRGN